MNIYLIERVDKDHEKLYDVYVSAVVIAESEFDARHIHPSGMPDDADDYTKRTFQDTWVEMEYIKVTLIGESYFSDEQIILAHFQAG